VSYAAVLGYRRSRRNFLGMQARVVTIRDGELRVVDRAGEVNERVAVADTRATLKRGMVEVTAGDRSFFLFGYPAINKVPRELLERMEAADVMPEPGESAFKVSRQFLEVMQEHGARP